MLLYLESLYGLYCFRLPGLPGNVWMAIMPCKPGQYQHRGIDRKKKKREWKPAGKLSGNVTGQEHGARKAAESKQVRRLPGAYPSIPHCLGTQGRSQRISTQHSGQKDKGTGFTQGKELLKKWTDRLHQKVISTAEQDQAGTDHGRSEGRQYGVKPEQKPIGGSLDRLAGECQQQKK